MLENVKRFAKSRISRLIVARAARDKDGVLARAAWARNNKSAIRSCHWQLDV
jgi:hypothetical protein